MGFVYAQFGSYALGLAALAVVAAAALVLAATVVRTAVAAARPQRRPALTVSPSKMS